MALTSPKRRPRRSRCACGRCGVPIPLRVFPELEEVRKLAREAEAKGKSAAFIHEDLRKLAAFSKGRTVEDDEIPGLARGRSDRWTDSTKKLREALEAFGSL